MGDRVLEREGVVTDIPGDTRVLTIIVLNDFAHVQGGASKVAIDEAVSLAEAAKPGSLHLPQQLGRAASGFRPDGDEARQCHHQRRSA